MVHERQTCETGQKFEHLPKVHAVVTQLLFYNFSVTLPFCELF